MLMGVEMKAEHVLHLCDKKKKGGGRAAERSWKKENLEGWKGWWGEVQKAEEKVVGLRALRRWWA